MSGNKLSSLSAEVGSLRKLHRLIADGNLLTSIPGNRTLPASPPRQVHSCTSGAAHHACVPWHRPPLNKYKGVTFGA